jgi:hypothetical protein
MRRQSKRNLSSPEIPQIWYFAPKGKIFLAALQHVCQLHGQCTKSLLFFLRKNQRLNIHRPCKPAESGENVPLMSRQFRALALKVLEFIMQKKSYLWEWKAQQLFH